MAQQKIEESWAFVELELVHLLGAQERANVDAKVLLIGQRRRQTEEETVVVRL